MAPFQPVSILLSAPTLETARLCHKSSENCPDFMTKSPDFCPHFSQLGGDCGGDLPEQHHPEGQRQVR